MSGLYHVSVTLQVLAALLWIGGTFFLRGRAPVLRRVQPPALRAQLFASLADQFRRVGWAAMGVLIVRCEIPTRGRQIRMLDLTGPEAAPAGSGSR